MPIQLEFENIHQLIEYLETVTGEKINKNKLYQAMKLNKPYKGHNVSFARDMFLQNFKIHNEEKE